MEQTYNSSMDYSVPPPTYMSHLVNPVDSLDKTEPPPYWTLSTTSSQESQSSLTISTTGDLPSTGFLYHPSLFDFNISLNDWFFFTRDLQRAASPTSSQKFLATAVGVSVALVIMAPRPSYKLGRYVLRKQVINNVKKGLEETDEPDRDRKNQKETVAAVLRKWNSIWAKSGVVARLEVLETGEDETLMKEGPQRNRSRRERKERKYFKIVLEMSDEIERER